MKKGKIYILFFLLSILLTACPMDDKDLIAVYNNSESKISFLIASQASGSSYPDTSLSLGYHGVVIERETFCEFYQTPLKYAYKEDKVDTLCVFILDADTVSKYDWDYIRSEYKILQRYDMSLKDFERLKYTIYYPPTDAMRDIKMYPPYMRSE